MVRITTGKKEIDINGMRKGISETKILKTIAIVKASRKISRDEEIEFHGKQIWRKKIHQSKKLYKRKK